MKYYIKLIRIFTIICMLFTIVISSIFYYYNLNIRMSNINNTADFLLRNIAQNADSNMISIYEISSILKTNEYVLNYLNKTEPVYYNKLKLQEYLGRNLGIVSNALLMISVTDFESDHVVTNTSTMDLSDFLVLIGLDKSIIKQAHEYFDNIYETNSIFIESNYNSNTNSSVNVLTIIRREILSNNKPFYILATYDVKKLLSYTSLQKDATVCISVNDKPVCSVGSMKRDLLIDAMAGNQKHIYNSYLTSSALGGTGYINYNYYIDKKEIDNEAKGVLITSLIIGFFILLIATAFMILITKNIYRPIRSILNNFSDSPHVGTEDEFEYINDRLDSLTVKNEDLLSLIQGYRIPLKEKFLRDLLSGIIPANEISNQLEQFGYNNFTGPFNTVIIEYINFSEIDTNFSNEAFYAIKKHTNIILKEYFKEYSFFEILEIDFIRLVIIINEKNTDVLKDKFKHFLVNFESTSDINMMAVLGTPTDSISLIYQSFSLCLEIISTNMSKTLNSMVLSIDDIKNESNNNFYYSLDIEQSLISNVIRGRKEDVHNILTNILKKNLEERILTPEMHTQLVFLITSTINRIIIELKKNINDIFSEGSITFLDLKMCNNAKELQEKLFAIFDSLVDVVFDERKNLDDTICDKMLNYIDNNYRNDISLLDLAEYLNLSKNYVSTLFKNLTSQNFKDYLNHHRYLVAKEILEENPKIKIKDLAKEVGCGTPNILFRIFNKYEGMSPGKYIKLKYDNKE